MNKVMNKEDFTEEELNLLQAIFKAAEAFVEVRRRDRYDVDSSNILFEIKEKLGIYDLVS